MTLLLLLNLTFYLNFNDRVQMRQNNNFELFILIIISNCMIKKCFIIFQKLESKA